MKTRMLLLVLIVVMLIMLSGSSPSNAGTSTAASSALSGGQYMLTIQTGVGTQSTGYRLVTAGTTALPGQGCCCKNFLSCLKKP